MKGQELLKEIRYERTDWEKTKRLVKELGGEINDICDGETILSEFFLGAEDGEKLLKLTRLFLSNGYDVKANSGFNGYATLRNLCWASYDRYILDIAELLLDAGADTNPQDEWKAFAEIGEEEDGILENILWKLAYWSTGRYDTANLFEAYFDMIEAFNLGKDYHGIRDSSAAIGKTITAVERITLPKIEGAEDYCSGDDAIVLWCGEMPLTVSWYLSIKVNPYIPGKAVRRQDISDEYCHLIGHKIQGLKYCTANTAMLNLDHGFYVLILNDRVFGNNVEPDIRMIMQKDPEPVSFSPGMDFEGIFFEGRRTYPESEGVYSEDTVLLKRGGTIYRIWCGMEDSRQGEERGSLLTDTLSSKDVPGIESARSAYLTNIRFDHLAKAGDKEMLIFKCDEGWLYIQPNNFCEVEFCLSEELIEKPERIHRFNREIKPIRWKEAENTGSAYNDSKCTPTEIRYMELHQQGN